MELADLIPYLFGGGAVTLIGFAATWRRKDAHDAIQTANQNIEMAVELRDAARKESVDLRIRVEELETTVLNQASRIAELTDLVASLRRRLAHYGGDPE